MRYSYVEPAPVESAVLRRESATKRAVPILKRSAPIDVEDANVPADARRLVLDGREARPGWVFMLTHSVTLNEAGNGVVHHVFIRVYGEGGEPLGHCGWTAGHTTGGRIWNHHPERRIPFAFVNKTEFAAWVRNEAYLPPAVAERGPCPRCTALDVRIKKDGNPYKHKDPLSGTECE